jgi:hypothetical protein
VNAPQGERKVKKSGVSSRGVAVKFWFCVCLWATRTTPPIVICGLNFPFKKILTYLPKIHGCCWNFSPTQIGFFGGNQIGQVGFLQICKRSFFFERMVFEDEENGQWVVPIHMISAFFFLFLFSEQCEANQIILVAWLLSVTLGFGKQVTQILCS